MASDIEEPGWVLLDQLDAVELRRYEPTIEARTALDSSAQTSSGFRRLAGYIFGGNETGESIAMTAPVAETLASVGAAWCVDREKFKVFGQEINGNHLRPNYEGWVTGTARPVHIGRQSQVWAVEVRNEAGKLTCIGRMTMAAVAVG